MTLRQVFLAACAVTALAGCKGKPDATAPAVWFVPIPAQALAALPPSPVIGVYGWGENSVGVSAASLDDCLHKHNPLEDILPNKGPLAHLPDASVMCLDARDKGLLLLGSIREEYPRVLSTRLTPSVRPQAAFAQAERYFRVSPDRIRHFRDREVLAVFGLGIQSVMQNYPTVAAATQAFPELPNLVVRHWDTGAPLLVKAPDGSFYAHQCLTAPQEQRTRGQRPPRPDPCASVKP